MSFLRSMALGAIIKIGVEGSEELKKLSGQFNTANNAVSAFGTGMGQLAGLAGSAALFFGGIAAGATALAVGGIASAASMEQTTLAFTTMLKGADKAQAFIGEMEAFAAKTPFNFPELANTAKQMKAFGFETEQIIPIMTSIGDATSAMGGDAQMVGRVTLALGQMKTKGKATTEEMNQLIETGVFGWTDLAKSIGKSIPETMDMVTKGQVSSAAALDAFTQHSTEAFGGAMDLQSRSFEGLMSNFQDAMGKTQRTMFTPLSDAIKPMMALAGGLLGAIGSGMTKASGSTLDMVDVIARVNKAVAIATPAMEALGAGVMGVMLAIGDVAVLAEKGMEKIAGALPAGAMQLFGKMVGSVAAVSVALTPIMGTLTAIFGGLAVVAASVSSIGLIPLAIGMGLAAQAMAVMMPFIGVGVALFASFRHEGESVGDTLARMGRTGMMFLARFVEPIQRIWPIVSNSFNQTFGIMSNSVDVFASALGMGGSSLINVGTTAEKVGNVIAILALGVAGAVRVFAELFRVGAAMVGGFLEPGVRQVRVFASAISGLVSGVLTLGDTFRLIFGGVVDSFFTPIKSQLLAMLDTMMLVSSKLGATEISAKLGDTRSALATFSPIQAIAGEQQAKLAAAALEDEKRMRASASSPDVTANVTVTTKQKVCIDNTLKVDGKNMAIATKNAEVELSDRAGFGATPWQQRQVLERGATLVPAI